MSLAVAREHRQLERDAAIGATVAAGCGLAFTLLVALPVVADVRAFDAGPLGFVLGAVLAPVAAGLAAYASVATLRARESGLTRRAHRLHVTTVAVTAGLLIGYAASSGALRTWLD